MTLGILQALVSAVADELALLRGQRMTRLTAQALPDQQVSRGSLNATSGDGTHVSLSSGAFGGGVLGGLQTIFRLLSSVNAGQQAPVQTVSSSTAIVLQGPGVPVFTNESWEVVRPADTAVAVESTLGWPTSGDFFLDGQRYRFTGTTTTTFTGITRWDGAAWVAGIGQLHAVGDVLVDYSRATTVLDLLRRSFFVQTAQDAELTVLGANHGRPRFEGLIGTETFRSYLRAVMYGPWGTRLHLENVLDAVVGQGDWEDLLDFTSSTDDYARVYVRRTNEDPTLLTGKAILDGDAVRLPSSSTQVTVAETPIHVGSVTLATDRSTRTVASGTAATTADGVTLNGSAGQFPAAILAGDRFEVLSGPRAGEAGLVRTNVSTSQIVLGLVRGSGNAVLSGASPAFAWRITRAVTNCRFVKPSADTALEYDTDTGTQAWTWQGTDTEANGAVVTSDATFGDRTAIGVSAVGLTGYYRRQARVTADSNARFEVLCTPATATTRSTTDGRQALIDIRDGTRSLAAGWFKTDGVHDSIALIDSSSGANLSPIVQLATPAQYREVVVEKRGTGPVTLTVDGVLLGTVPYASFPTASEHELRVGTLSAPSGSSFNNVRHIGWSIDTETDFWAARSVAATTTSSSANVGGLGGILQVGDIGSVLYLRRGTARNPGGGTVNGEWLVGARVDANTATVTGRTRKGATFQRGFPAYVFLPDDYALAFPDALGHSVEILSGTQTGVYAIARLRDSDFRDLSKRQDGTSLDSLLLHGDDGSALITGRALVVEVASPPVGGFDASQGFVDWRIVPTFPTDSALLAELSEAGTLVGSTLTLRQALPITSPLPPLAVLFSTETSAHIESPEDDANPNPIWPAYLYDAWGLLRDPILDAVAAGVELDLDSLQRDSSGLHILDS